MNWTTPAEMTVTVPTNPLKIDCLSLYEDTDVTADKFVNDDPADLGTEGVWFDVESVERN